MENRVGFGPRLLALLIDFAGMWVLTILFYIVVPQIVQPFVDYQMAQVGEESLSRVSFDITPVIVFINLLIFTRLIFFSSEIVFGTSLGKYLLKLKITNRLGEKPSMGQLTARFAIKHIYPLLNLFSLVLFIDFVGTLALIFGAIVYFGCFFVLGDNKLSLQDVISGTMVITDKKAEPVLTSKWISDSEVNISN
jgi:uncharacterized RDD family membrane protein YckC